MWVSDASTAKKTSAAWSGCARVAESFLAAGEGCLHLTGPQQLLLRLAFQSIRQRLQKLSCMCMWDKSSVKIQHA